MSHFTVLVHIPASEIDGDNIESLVQAKLQPFHEYECTGRKDQYVIEVDETDEKLKEYNIDTMDVVMFDNKFYGSKYSKQCERFWNRGYSSSDSKLVLPEGYTLRENVHCSEVYTFKEYLKDWLGYELDGKYSDYRAERFYRYTNPNSKWDWWTIGGRWSDHFLGKDGVKYDIIKVKDWDLDTPMKEVLDIHTKFYDKYEASGLDEIEFISWSDCRTMFDGDWTKIREFYWGQEYIKKLTELFSTNEEEEKYSWVLHDPTAFYKISRDSYMKARYYNIVGSFVILFDGKWVEKGDMGWFGMSSNEKADWDETYLDKIKNFDDNDYLVLVDCHI